MKELFDFAHESAGCQWHSLNLSIPQLQVLEQSGPYKLWQWLLCSFPKGYVSGKKIVATGIVLAALPCQEMHTEHRHHPV